MKQGTRGEAQIDVAAPPARVYAVVSDVTRMGEWSPETTRCEWLDGADGPVVGARFKGSNKRGIARWSTKPRVTAAEPGREFAFVIQHRGHDITKWTYQFEPVGSGTRVTESFELLRDMPWYFIATDRYLMRVEDRYADLVDAMQQTLARIKTVVEAAPA
jgi:uncharacterized protein YndB with AHSA1/START domain